MNSLSRILVLLLSLTAFSVKGIAASENLQANFYYASFFSPESGPFLETYMTIVGRSAVFAPVGTNQKQASIEVIYLFKQAGEIKKAEKIVLLSPVIAATDSVFPNFTDISRIPLANGVYDLEVRVRDLTSEKSSSVSQAQIQIDYQPNVISMSGLEWLEKYEPSVQQSILSKSGFDLTPYVSNYFPENISNLSFYQEVYNLSRHLGEGDQLLLRYYLESAGTKRNLQEYFRQQKISAKEVNVVLGKMDISGLPSGNYNLVIELVNKQNEVLLSSRNFMQRSNPSAFFSPVDLAAVDVNNTFVTSITNVDSMYFYLDALYPISTQVEEQYARNVSKSGDLLKMQQYFYNFWQGRNPGYPEQEWLMYKRVLQLVNDKYSTQTTKGYKTDRGRVYLKYGSPNAFVEEKDIPNSYPFEIWQYYQLGDEKNVRFIFYNPHRAWRTYELLHSTYRSELQNDNWLIQLYDYYSPLAQIDNIKYDLKTLKNTDFGVRVLTLWENP